MDCVHRWNSVAFHIAPQSSQVAFQCHYPADHSIRMQTRLIPSISLLLIPKKNLVMELLLFVLCLKTALGLDNGLGLTPPMGWSPKSDLGCSINETVIRTTAYMLAATGLRDLGYTYVNLNDCWAMKGRAPTGQLIPDPTRFPSGINGLADYIHSLGLKLGIYSDAGNYTCQGQPGSWGYEEMDAKTFAAWGVDYLKYDSCYPQNTSAPARYWAMRNAIMSVERPIYHSVSTQGMEEVISWGRIVGNSWRTTTDLRDDWKSMLDNLRVNTKHPEIAGIGGWNDPDVLKVGNGNMTDVEYQTQFTLWALLKAPLIFNCDLTNMTNSTFAILSNPEIIAINQDRKGQQGTCKCYCTWGDNVLRPQIWSASLHNGDTAVIAFNIEDGPTRDYNISLWGLGLFEAYEVRDLWEHRDLGVVSVRLPVETIERHAVKAYRLHRSVGN